MRFFIIALINSFMVKQNWFAKNSRCIVILSAAKDLVYIHVGAFEMLWAHSRCFTTFSMTKAFSQFL